MLRWSRIQNKKNALKAEVVGALETPAKEYKEGTLLRWSGLRKRKSPNR